MAEKKDRVAREVDSLGREVARLRQWLELIEARATGTILRGENEESACAAIAKFAKAAIAGEER